MRGRCTPNTSVIDRNSQGAAGFSLRESPQEATFSLSVSPRGLKARGSLASRCRGVSHRLLIWARFATDRFVPYSTLPAVEHLGNPGRQAIEYFVIPLGQHSVYCEVKNMARLFKDITETIGRTPLVRINRIIQSDAEV